MSQLIAQVQDLAFRYPDAPDPLFAGVGFTLYAGARAAKLQRRSILAKERRSQRVDELERARPWVDKRYEVAFPDVRAPTGTCLAVRDLRFGHGECELLNGVSFTLAWGERVALVGRNGVGKSTLIELLLGEIAPRRGEVLWGRGADIGHLPQLWSAPLGVEVAAELFAATDRERARSVLGALGVGGDAFVWPLAALSEGQKRKLRLVQLMLAAPNVLILDEPTTHLDYRSVEMLEAALEDYPGTLLLVSHDRRLRERVCDRVLLLEAGEVRAAETAG